MCVGTLVFMLVWVHVGMCVYVCVGGGGRRTCVFVGSVGDLMIPEWMLLMPSIQLPNWIANCRVVNLCDGLKVSLSITYTLK